MAARKMFKHASVSMATATAKSLNLTSSTAPRTRLIECWRPKNSRCAVDIAVARKEDTANVRDFMMNETRFHEPVIGASKASESDVKILFDGILERSIDSGLSLLMFKANSNELIGIRMTSLVNLPQNRRQLEDFQLLSDYKSVIDRQPSKSRKEQRILALCDQVYPYAEKFVPKGVRQMVRQELVGIMENYRLHSLATRFNHEMYKLAANEGLQFVDVLCTGFASQRVCRKLGMRPKIVIPYDEFTDDHQICFLETVDKSRAAVYMIGDLMSMGYSVHGLK
ncbi:hypothetical protein M3Y94_00207700 [Aphelenchoides besseyi]|nr:hypothetical protein M3Y94_00207700 [Aphelenchoides besseyi]